MQAQITLDDAIYLRDSQFIKTQRGPHMTMTANDALAIVLGGIEASTSLDKNMIPVEALQVGDTIIINDKAWGKMAYLVEEIIEDGDDGFDIVYSDETEWNDRVWVGAGEFVEVGK